MSETPDFDTKAGERDTAIPRFEMKPIQTGTVDGKPRFEEKEFVTIVVPGDRKTEWYGRVTEEHIQRWPRIYAAWKQGLEAPTEGTPLTEVAWINRAQAEELAFQHVKTVEQLAALTDAQLKNTISMGGYPLRDRAKRHIEELNNSAPAEKLAAENAELRGTMEAMQAQMDAMAKRLDEATAQKASAGAAPQTA